MSDDRIPAKYKIVTSLNAKLWQKFMNKTVGSLFHHYQDTDQEIFVFLDSDQDFPTFDGLDLSGNIQFSFLNQAPPYLDFIRKFGDGVPIRERGINPEKIQPGAKYKLLKYEAFAKKAYSWALLYTQLKEGEVLVWIDGDIILTRKIEPENFQEFLPDGFDLCYLDRDFPMYSAETGFFMLRKSPEADQFVNLFLATYATGFIFDLQEWHDGFVFKTLLKLTPQLRRFNLNPVVKEVNVFERTMLADFMIHFKGNLKDQLKDQPDHQQQTTGIIYDPEDQDYE